MTAGMDSDGVSDGVSVNDSPDDTSPASFRDKLRRLRRDKRMPLRDEGIPPWLKQRLSRRAGDSPAGTLQQGDVGDPTDLLEGSNERGRFCFRETVLESSDLHGDWSLAEIRHADTRAFALLGRNESLEHLDVERCLFLDTETSGLGGGAGMYVFLVGLGFFRGDSFHVWQGFLRDPKEEAALLEETARLMREAGSLISFFGKSFDRHRLEDKMRISGVEPPFAVLPHLDLYHPLRRLTKGDFPDGRLCTMESRLCGLQRKDDLSGAFAPSAWFDYLANRPHQLAGVFQHNLDDVLSLVTLAAYLGRCLAGYRHDLRPLEGAATTRVRELARAYEADHNRAQAIVILDGYLESTPSADQPRDLLLQRAELLRLLGRLPQARRAFESILEDEDGYSVPAAVSLAKLLEHRIKDRPAAQQICESALEALSLLAHGPHRTVLERDLKRRLIRLTRTR